MLFFSRQDVNGHSVGHFLFEVDIYCLTKTNLKLCVSDEVVWRMISPYFCSLPVVNFRFHCHCPSVHSLRCKAASVVLNKLLCSIPIEISSTPPWTNCCSRICNFCVNGMQYLVCWTTWKETVAAVLCNYSIHFYFIVSNKRCIFTFRCQAQTLTVLLTALHRAINHPALGYHLGSYDVQFWKSLKSIGLHGTAPCTVRFLRINGEEYQERYIKQKLSQFSSLPAS